MPAFQIMKAAIWFSRHQPTPEQIDDAARMGWQIVGIPEGMALGAVNIDDNAADVAESIRALAREHGARAVFGVFPTPILALAARAIDAAILSGVSTPEDLGLYAAHNVSRTPEGGKPTFTHKAWHWISMI